ncbi:MAG: HNH endonuclease [Gaiellales bacterium]
MEKDETMRVACFRNLDSLRARFGDDLPSAEALAPGFEFDGQRVPFRNPQKGIYRAARQRGQAALSIVTTFSSPYEADEATDDGFWYAYREGSVDLADNRALRAACALQVPLVYFVGTAKGWYRALYPCYIAEDDLHARRVRVEVGALRFGEPTLSSDLIDRRYAVREARVRLHQGRFRGVVLPAYRERCAICQLHELKLLDAAHIIGDREPAGVPTVRNGLSLCTIHHRAFDQNLVGVDPDYRVHVAERLLDDHDGPMLELLKTFHQADLVVPGRVEQRPDRELLGARYELFRAA